MEKRAPVIDLPFTTALRFWVKLGFISFGGPAGQIAIMHREIVEQRRWIGEQRFLHALNFCMLLPGPEAQQLATYIGWLLHGVRGGLAAGLCFVLPSIVLLLGLAYVYCALGTTSVVAGILAGFKPVVVALVVEAVIRIGRRALKRNIHYFIAVAAFTAIFGLRIAFPWIILAAAAFGFVGARWWPTLFAEPSAGAPGPEAALAPRALIDDRDEPPAHTRPSRRWTLATLSTGVVLWLLPFAMVLAARGWEGLALRQYRFFTLAAFVTFGGAYAVLAYVTQAAVTTFGWITHAQAVDGLALAETTPGPLIMVLQFVAFVAGWNHPESLSPLTQAVLCALVTTYVTFLPCFVFVFLGAPYIEKLRSQPALRHALAGVTAAVVGVVLNLALVLGTAVIFPQGLTAAPSCFALSASIVAFGLLYWAHLGVLWVVALGGAAGWLVGVLAN